MTQKLKDRYDVVVVGGGAAGLSGALMLGRARRSVLVIDAGSPRNAPADGVHGLLGHDGIAPAVLADRGRAEVRGYDGQIVPGEVVAATPVDGGFEIELGDGRAVRARRLLVTSGLVDELPEIASLRERWGRDVLHCPYCHGWEVRDQPIGVIASSAMSVHQALLFRQWSADITFFRNEIPIDAEQNEQLLARGITIVDGPVAAVEVHDDRLTGVRLADGRVVPRSAVTIASRMVARAGFLAGLGLTPIEHPSGMGEHLPVDAAGRTNVPGVWAAGNVADLSAQVGAAAAAAAFAAAQINADLVVEETQRAVVAAREAAA